MQGKERALLAGLCFADSAVHVVCFQHFRLLQAVDCGSFLIKRCCFSHLEQTGRKWYSLNRSAIVAHEEPSSHYWTLHSTRWGKNVKRGKCKKQYVQLFLISWMFSLVKPNRNLIFPPLLKNWYAGLWGCGFLVGKHKPMHSNASILEALFFSNKTDLFSLDAIYLLETDTGATTEWDQWTVVL